MGEKVGRQLEGRAERLLDDRREAAEDTSAGTEESTTLGAARERAGDGKGGRRDSMATG